MASGIAPLFSNSRLSSVGDARYDFRELAPFARIQGGRDSQHTPRVANPFKVAVYQSWQSQNIRPDDVVLPMMILMTTKMIPIGCQMTPI